MRRVPKTGLAKRVRSAVQNRRFFTISQVAAELGVKNQDVYRSIDDFLKRGEIIRTGVNGRYQYNSEYKAPIKGRKQKKIYKAMYVAGEFTSNDILKYSGTVDASFVMRLIRKLIKSGYVVKIATKKRESGSGLENKYRIIDRENFRKEYLR